MVILFLDNLRNIKFVLNLRELGPMLVMEFPEISRCSTFLNRSKLVMSGPIFCQDSRIIVRLSYSSSVGSLSTYYRAAILAAC